MDVQKYVENGNPTRFFYFLLKEHCVQPNKLKLKPNLTNIEVPEMGRRSHWVPKSASYTHTILCCLLSYYLEAPELNDTKPHPKDKACCCITSNVLYYYYCPKKSFGCSPKESSIHFTTHRPSAIEVFAPAPPLLLVSPKTRQIYSEPAICHARVVERAPSCILERSPGDNKK